MSQDEHHVRLLSIFHYVCAGMVALCACYPIIHLLVGLAMVLRPHSFGPGPNQPPALIGWVFVLIAGAFIFFGWLFAALLVWAGRCLGRRKHYSFCLVAAGIACLFMPFGTVLGVFTILVLTQPSIKTLFEIQRQPQLAA